MRCEELERHLADHLSGTLPVGTADAAAVHLQSCSRCAAEAAALADTWHALADLLIVPADTGGMRAAVTAVH